jgi:hypothetical protein
MSKRRLSFHPKLRLDIWGSRFFDKVPSNEGREDNEATISGDYCASDGVSVGGNDSDNRRRRIKAHLEEGKMGGASNSPHFTIRNRGLKTIDDYEKRRK